jgi:hypothetical protein
LYKIPFGYIEKAVCEIIAISNFPKMQMNNGLKDGLNERE